MSHLPTAQRPDPGGPLGSISSNPSTCTSKNKPHYVWLLVSSQSGLQLSYLRSCLLGHQGPRPSLPHQTVGVRPLLLVSPHPTTSFPAFILREAPRAVHWAVRVQADSEKPVPPDGQLPSPPVILLKPPSPLGRGLVGRRKEKENSHTELPTELMTSDSSDPSESPPCSS